jgi:hypothetical protein
MWRNRVSEIFGLLDVFDWHIPNLAYFAGTKFPIGAISCIWFDEDNGIGGWVVEIAASLNC